MKADRAVDMAASQSKSDADRQCGRSQGGKCGEPASPAAVCPQIDGRRGACGMADGPEPAAEYGSQSSEHERQAFARTPIRLRVPERRQNPEAGPERLAGRVPDCRREHDRRRPDQGHRSQPDSGSAGLAHAPDAR